MKVFLILALVAALLAMQVCIKANAVDMKDVTCRELINMAEHDRDTGDASSGVIEFWLDGYLSGISSDTSFDTDRIVKTFAPNIGAYCALNPDVGVLAAARTVGLQH